MSQAASFRIIAAPWRSKAPVFLYNPLTAADEKIPLSVVRVNNKPQHLVFCWHFAHLLSKHRHLPVESLKWPCLARCRAVCFALKSGQRVGPWPVPVPLSKVSPSRTLSQGAGVVQNRAGPVRIVEIGDRNRRCLCPKPQIAMWWAASAGAGRGQLGFHRPLCGRTRRAFRARTGAARCSPNRSLAPFPESGQASENTHVIRQHIAPPAPRSTEVWCTG